MKLGIMQPYFMPYLGYISLIKHTDRFILFDTVQFIRHGWIERNRILKQNGGWSYIQVPLVKNDGRDTLIKDILINNKEKWQDKILAQLQHYKKKAPYYFNTINLLNEIFSIECKDIVTLNEISLNKICEYLGIKRKMEVFSKMNLKIDTVNAPDEWALNICKAIDGVDEYINPPGGQSFFDKSKYDKENIKLRFQEIELTPYNQKQEIFEPGLSIIDVMMFNSVEEINIMLDNYKLI
jgi:hypothetical protein